MIILALDFGTAIIFFLICSRFGIFFCFSIYSCPYIPYTTAKYLTYPQSLHVRTHTNSEARNERAYTVLFGDRAQLYVILLDGTD